MRMIPGALLLLLLAAPFPAGAQDSAAPPLTAEAALANAAARYTTRNVRPDPCPETTGDVIVVCRRLEDPESQGLRSPTEQAIADGLMPPGQINPPDVFGIPPCTSGCIPVGRKPVAPLIIDLKAIPEAPPGSAAARYAGN